MNAYRLESSRMLSGHLLRAHVLYAPVQSAGDAHWQRVTEPVELQAPPVRPLISPKALLFAEREVLFAFDGKRFVATQPVLPRQAVLGVTACDLTAIAYQDQFFAEDPYYRARREATLLVGIDCHEACPGAFCGPMDAGPSVRPASADLVLVPDASAYVLLATSAQGQAAMVGLELPAAPEGWEVRRRQQQERVEGSMQAPHVPAAVAKINGGQVSAQTWEALGLQCVACTGCTTVCPTCSCFTTRDRSEPEGMLRERLWDSCLLEGFQREASGHNPAASAGQRVERFWYHKFAEPLRDVFGRYGCVGCGRCEQICPGVIGVHSALKRIAAS